MDDLELADLYYSGHAFAIVKVQVELWFPKIDSCMGIISIGEVRCHKVQEKKKEKKNHKNENNGKLLGKVPAGEAEERYINLGLGGLLCWVG